MKRSLVVFIVLLLGVVITAQRGGPSPEQQAAMAKQDALEKPRLSCRSPRRCCRW